MVDDAPMASMFGLAGRIIRLPREQQEEERKVVRLSRPKGRGRQEPPQAVTTDAFESVIGAAGRSVPVAPLLLDGRSPSEGNLRR